MARAVQISGLKDPAALIWLGERVLQPAMSESGWGRGLDGEELTHLDRFRRRI
jgi:hypothetical protein